MLCSALLFIGCVTGPFPAEERKIKGINVPVSPAPHLAAREPGTAGVQQGGAPRLALPVWRDRRHGGAPSKPWSQGPISVSPFCLFPLPFSQFNSKIPHRRDLRYVQYSHKMHI